MGAIKPHCQCNDKAEADFFAAGKGREAH